MASIETTSSVLGWDWPKQPVELLTALINIGVDAFYGPTHDRARSRGARRGSLQHLLRGAVRPVRGM